MKFKRNPMNVWYAFWRALDRGASKVKVIRWIFGGSWVKIDGSWQQVDTASIQVDGTRYFYLTVNGQRTSFHETHESIQALENWS